MDGALKDNLYQMGDGGKTDDHKNRDEYVKSAIELKQGGLLVKVPPRFAWNNWAAGYMRDVLGSDLNPFNQCKLSPGDDFSSTLWWLRGKFKGDRRDLVRYWRMKGAPR